MFHVKHTYNHINHLRLHKLLFYLFLLTLPFQIRIIYNKPEALINGEFSYYLAIIVYLSDLLLLAAIFAWLFTDFPQKYLKTRSFLIFSIIAVLPLLSLFHVEPTTLFIYGWLKWLSLIALIWYISKNFHEKSAFSSIYWIFFISGVIQSLVGIYQFHVQHSAGLSWLGEYVSTVGTPGLATIDFLGSKIVRAYGTFPHPNMLGGFLVVALLSGLALVSRETITRKLFVSIGMFLLIFGLFFSFSRTAWVAAIILISAYLLRLIKAKQVISIKIILILLVVSCGTLMISFRELLVSRSIVVPESTAVSYRTDFNAQAVEIWKTQPITGVGLNQYVLAYSTIKPGLAAWQYQPAHNIILVFVAELGIITATLLLTLVVLVIGFTWNNRSDEAFAIRISLLCLLVLGLFDHYLLTIQQGRLMLFVILGLLSVIFTVSHETISAETKNKVE